MKIKKILMMMICTFICFAVCALRTLQAEIKISKEDDDSATVVPASAVADEMKISVNGEVALSEIPTYMFEDVIALIEYNGVSTSVQWGMGDLYFMWYKSGYPGFGYSIVIQSSNVVAGGGDVTLSTEYGKYIYEYETSIKSFCENDVLYSAGNNEILANFGVNEEKLYLYNSQTKLTQVYHLIEQTEIVL